MATINDQIPKSRITLTYRTDVSGKPEDIQLPLRLLVMGDLSRGSSKDSKQELDKRQPRQLDGKNLDDVMKDMNMSVEVRVKNVIDPDKSGEDFTAKIPITGMRSFKPSEVAHHVPKLRSLLLLKKLLHEVQANIDNRKEFRTLLREMSSHPEKVEALLSELSGFEDFRVPPTDALKKH